MILNTVSTLLSVNNYINIGVIPIFTPMVLGLMTRVASAVVYNDIIESTCLPDGLSIFRAEMYAIILYYR